MKVYRTASISLVRQRLEYASALWNPFYNKDIDRLERVQHSFTRNAVSHCLRSPGSARLGYDRRLEILKLEPLHLRRLTLTCKILTSNIDLHFGAFFVHSMPGPRFHNRKIAPITLPHTVRGISPAGLYCMELSATGGQRKFSSRL